ncbi:WD repeat domain-containing protein [Podospora fimiseda]|uniref:WD repeat domain-containing protein n=1 Tax=Podospora fimiseda TaxID=252190 RepID=A0AAN7H4U9_9PEZI|nr:WD repeat domain-containing protein [Podospora fimiseda]
MSATHHTQSTHGNGGVVDDDENEDSTYENQGVENEEEEEAEAENDDDDDDDEDYEEEEDDDEDDDYGDPPPIEIEVEIQGVTGGPVTRTLRIGPGGVSQRQLLELLRGGQPTGFGWGFYDSDDDGIDAPPRAKPEDFPKVPSEEGIKLMGAGLFGYCDIRDPRQKSLARRLLDRELGLGAETRNRNRGLMLQQQIPMTKPEFVIHYDEPVCCGQFSDDGNFFYNAAKDFKVRLYDTSNPYQWRHYKTVLHPFGQWTLTDSALSPDNKWLAFTSLQPEVCITPTDPTETGEPYTLDFAPPGYRFAIFSIRFSNDGKHLIAGTGADSIVVYDIERRTPIHWVKAHQNDVNAVCFADKMSPHVLYSGSDDATIKVWDTRSIGGSRPAGAFIGHTQGITYIDSKGDGRYILSNGKEQSMKLWDLRMAKSGTWFEETRPTVATESMARRYDYDYRWQDYDDGYFYKHPHDNSLVTFRGHKVQRTLIRCHFSPPGSTDSRYVYSGSHDGNIWIWNLDATIAAKIDVKAATSGRVKPKPRRFSWHREHTGEQTTLVRDVGWHPHAPMLVASSWSGGAMDAGTASIHSWNDGDFDEGELEMGRSVDEKLNPLDPALLVKV